MALPTDLDQDKIRRALEMTGGSSRNIFADDSAPQIPWSTAPTPPAARAASEAAAQTEATKPQYQSLAELQSLPAPEPAAPEVSAPPAAAPSAPEPASAEPQPPVAPESPAPAKPAPRRAEAPAAVPGPDLEQEVEDRVFDRKDSTRSLQGQMQAGQNRALDLTEQVKGGIQAEGQAAAGAELRDLREIQQARREDATARVDMNREQKRQFEDRMMMKVDELSEKMRNPPKDTMGMVMGIIGMAMAAKGDGKGAALAQGLGQAFGSKMKKWEAGLAADQQEFSNLKSLFSMQNDDSESELKQEAQLSQLAVAEFDSALKAVAAETGSKEAKATAEAARLELRQKYVAHQMDIRARAIAAERERQIYRTLGSAPTPEQRAALASQIGPDGHKVLQNIEKTDKAAVDIDVAASNAEQNRAAAWKARNTTNEGESKHVEAGGSPIAGYKVGNPDIWNSLERPTKAKFQQGAAVLPVLNQQLQEYAALLREYGTENLPTQAKGTLQAKHATILGKVKEAAELGALDNGVITLVERMIGDPTAWNMGLGNVWENADVKAEETRKAIMNEAATKAKAYGLDMQAGAAGINFKPVK